VLRWCCCDDPTCCNFPRHAHGIAACLTLAAWLAATSPAVALSIRDDVAQADYATQAATAPFDATGRFDRNHSGNLIAWRWVLHSAHGANPSTFTTLNESAAIQSRVIYPGDPSASDAFDGYDFALAELADPILGVGPAQLYQGSAASLEGQSAVYTGGGKTGAGDVGATGARQILAGTNIIDDVGFNLGSGQSLRRRRMRRMKAKTIRITGRATIAVSVSLEIAATLDSGARTYPARLTE